MEDDQVPGHLAQAGDEVFVGVAHGEDDVTIRASPPHRTKPRRCAAAAESIINGGLGQLLWTTHDLVS
jgi:hypothetical protein